MSVFTVIILKFSFLFPFRREKWMQGGAIILVAGSFEAATLLPPAAQALNLSLGPGLELWDRMGPNGAQIFPVQNMDTFGLSGSAGLSNGQQKLISLGQIEPGEPLSTHAMFQGRSRTRGYASNGPDHATGVGSIMIGEKNFELDPAGTKLVSGIAHDAELFSSGYQEFYRNDNVRDFLGITDPEPANVTGIKWLIDKQVSAINLSGGFFDSSNNFIKGEDGSGLEALIVDWVVNENHIVFTQAAGNLYNSKSIIVPGDAFNAITVGSTGDFPSNVNTSEDYTRVSPFSSRGPTGDGRHKPDIVAPGGSILMASGQSIKGSQVDSGTSFAAPHVAGMAGLLIENGLERGISSNNLSLKSILLNSASKHVTDPKNMNRPWVDTPAATDQKIPVDDAMGIGQLNGLAATRQHQPGFRSDVGVQGQKITPGSKQTYDLFVGAGQLQPGSLITSTLTWNRPVVLVGGAGTMDGNYGGKVLPNLDLQLLKVGSPDAVDKSISMIDNVEHIYFNVTEKGSYQLQVVSMEEPVRGLTVNDYALAWSSGSSEGLAFSVDGGYFNPNRNDPNPAEGLMAPFGDNPYPNDVNALGPAGPGFFATDSEIFVSSENGTNMQRISGALGTRSRVGPHNGPPAGMAVLDPGEDANNNNRLDPSEDKNGNGKLDRQRGVLGLIPNDNISGLSWGTDGTNGLPSVLLFSVDPQTEGKVGTDVNYQAKDSPVGGPPVKPYADNPGGGDPGNEAAGDIYKSQKYNPFGDYDIDIIEPAPPGSNKLVIDEQQLGLQAPKSHGNLLKPISLDSGAETRCKFCEEDDLDALELDSVLSNPRRAVDPDGDGLHNQPIFFALDRWSPSLVKYGGPDVESADDIFVSRPPDLSNNFDLMPGTVFPKFNIFADGVTHMGLSTVDGLDALVLSDVLRIGILDPGYDEALFSLDPDSASTCGSDKSPANVYYTKFDGTCTLFASYISLGLLPNDNLDALDIKKTPGPLPFLGAGVAFRFSRKLRRRLRVYRMA